MPFYNINCFPYSSQNWQNTLENIRAKMQAQSNIKLNQKLSETRHPFFLTVQNRRKPNTEYELSESSIPYYTLLSEQSIEEQKQLDHSQWRTAIQQSRKKNLAIMTNQQSPEKKYQSKQIFNSVQARNFPACLYKNKYYAISQVNPALHQQNKIQSRLKVAGLTERIQKKSDSPNKMQTFNNQFQIPVFCFDRKAWSIESFRIVNFFQLSLNWTYLSRASQLKEKNKSYEDQSLLQKSIDKQKPLLYLPNQLVHAAQCKIRSQNHIMYLFGGIYQEMMVYSNKLWKVDFKEGSIEMIEHRGQIPQPRQGAALCSYNASWLILYGGFNLMVCQVFAQFYVFSIQNKTWSIIQADCQCFLNPRIDFSMNFNPQSRACYLFGGRLLDFNNKEWFLNDMYEFHIIDLEVSQKKIKQNRNKIKAFVQTKPILPRQGCKWPQKMAKHQSTWLNSDTMILLGGEIGTHKLDSPTNLKFVFQSTQPKQSLQSSKIYNKQIWIFQRKAQKWIEIKSQRGQNEWKGQISFPIDYRLKSKENQCEIILFGGLEIQNSNKIMKINFKTSPYQSMETKQNEKVIQKSCKFCNELSSSVDNKIKQNNCAQSQFEADTIDTYIMGGMPFAFSAFGLITELSIQSQSSKLYFSYMDVADLQQNNYLQIEEDGQLPYTAEEISSEIHSFSIYDELQILNAANKKYKAIHTRLSNVRRFCNKLKIAALRLGSEFKWIAATSNGQIIVYWLKSEQHQNSLTKEKQLVYKSYFYAEDENTLEILPQFSEEIKKQVEKHNKKLIQSYYKERKTLKSLIRIQKLRKIPSSEQKRIIYQLNPNFDQNSIFINEKTLNKKQFQPIRKLILEQSIDVNLRAYLSTFSINRHAKIYLKVNTTGKLSNSALQIENQGNSKDKSVSSMDKTQMNSQISLYLQKQINKVLSCDLIQKKHPHLLKQPIIFMDQQYEPEIKKFSLTYNPSPEKPSNNKFEQVDFQFMLSQIDQKLESQELIEVNLDPFEELQCKISQLYYWIGNKSKSEKQTASKSNLQKASVLNSQENFLYSNGLLIYCNGKLVKRYKRDLGMLPIMQWEFGNSTSLLRKNFNPNLDQIYHSANQLSPRLFGLINVSQQCVTNIFGNSFMNEFTLNRLYERIQNISMLYQKMFGRWKGLKIGRKYGDLDDLSSEKDDKIDNSRNDLNKNGKKKLKINEEFNLQK